MIWVTYARELADILSPDKENRPAAWSLQMGEDEHHCTNRRVSLHSFHVSKFASIRYRLARKVRTRRDPRSPGSSS
jgi:hypothetical protein